jgi:hypothetical protein
MRTAITLLKSKGKWVLKYGPDVDCDLQKREFLGGRQSFPEGATAILYQPSSGPARIRDLEKHERMLAIAKENERLAQKQIDDAEKAKRAHLKQTEAEAKAAAQATQAAEAHAEAKRKAGALAKGTIINPPTITP